MTGLTVHTIRAWEKRYNLNIPTRSEGGTRQYQDEDVKRLSLLKVLCDRGESIGAIAHLPLSSLQDRLAKTFDARSSCGRSVPLWDPEVPLRVAVLEGKFCQKLPERLPRGANIHFVEVARTAEEFIQSTGRRCAQVCLISLDVVNETCVEFARQLRENCSTSVVIFVYDLASRKVLTALLDEGAHILRGPLPQEVLARTIQELYFAHMARQALMPGADIGLQPRSPVEVPEVDNEAATEEGPIPERMFDDEQLAHLREVESSVECECPNHLSGLISNLISFEDYCQNCVSISPEDEALHMKMWRQTAKARQLMEKMLVEVCEHDGIKL